MSKLLALALLVALPAVAQPSSPPPVDAPFEGAQFRYPERNIALRTLSDFPAIVLGIPSWTVEDWTYAAAVMAPTIALMLPLDRPLDFVLQQRLDAWVPSERFHLWAPQHEPYIWLTLGGTALAMAGAGWLAGNRDLIECVSLMLESLAVAQGFHLAFKLALGRDTPNSGTGMGHIGGPLATLSLFPAGTPSGHATTLFAVFGAASAYFDSVPLAIVLDSAAAVVAGMLVVDRYHFLSDVIWGAGLGYAVGRWVVRHRSSHYRTVGRQMVPVSIIPEVSPQQSRVGVSAVWTF